MMMNSQAMFSLPEFARISDGTSVLTYILGNAEMTEIFKCRKAGTKCCAPKSLIKEAALGQIDEMHTKYTTTPSPGAGPPFTVQPVTMQTSKSYI